MPARPAARAADRAVLRERRPLYPRRVGTALARRQPCRRRREPIPSPPSLPPSRSHCPTVLAGGCRADVAERDRAAARVTPDRRPLTARPAPRRRPPAVHPRAVDGPGDRACPVSGSRSGRQGEDPAGFPLRRCHVRRRCVVSMGDTTDGEDRDHGPHLARPAPHARSTGSPSGTPGARYGVVADPLAAMGHNPRVLLTDARFETSLARWKRLDPTLKALAVMAVGRVDRLLVVRRLRLLGQHQRGRRPGRSCATSRAGGTATSTPTWSGRSWPTPRR